MPGMIEVAQATVTIIPTMDGAQQTIAEMLTGAEVQFSGAGQRMGSGMTEGFSAATVALGHVIGSLAMNAVNAFMDGLDAGIRRVDTLNNFGKVMQALGESEESVAASIDTIRASLDGLPSSTANVAALVQQVRATGMSLEDATDLTVAMNNALLAGGQGTAVAESAMQQYARAMSRGEFHMREFDTLVRAAPAQMAQLAQEILGVSDATGMDLYEAMKEGSVSMDEFNAAVVRLNEEGGEAFGTFEDQARAATGGIGTALENVNNRIANAWGILLEGIGTERIADTINSFSSSFSDMANAVAPAVSTVANGVLDLVGAVGGGLGGALEWAGNAFGIFLEAIKPATDAVAEFASGNGPAFTRMVEGMQPALDGVSEALAGVSELLGVFGTYLANIINTLAPIVLEVIASIGIVFAHLADAAAIMGEGVMTAITIITGAVDQVVGAIPGAIDQIVGFFQGLPGQISAAVSGIGDMLKGPFETAWNFIKSIPDKIAGIFSGFKIELPHINLPHIAWHMENIAGILDIPVFDGIQWYAAGGIVGDPALVGVGERGPELIWPAYDPYMSEYAEAIAAHMPGAGAVTNVYVDGSLLDVDRRTRDAMEAFLTALAVDRDK